MRKMTKLLSVLGALLLMTGSLLPATQVLAHDRHHSDQYIDIIVRYHEEVPSEEDLDPAFQNVQTMSLLPIQTMTVPASAVKTISQQENVRRVTYDQEMSTTEADRQAYSGDGWNNQIIRADEAWEKGFTGEAVRVAVLDTGFYNHPDITYAGGYSIFDEEHEWGADPWTNDHDGHGTHVAGIIGAHQGSRTQGVAPGVDLYGVKIYHHTRGNRTQASSLIEGLAWAIENNMDIITVSSGYPEFNPDIYEMIELAAQQGILIVAASGNRVDGNETVDYPAAHEEVIAVANVDNQFVRAHDSMLGLENELAAPGQDIMGLGTPVDGANHVLMSGTSQSTPHVVGIASLLMQKYPGESSERIRQRMNSKALDLGAPGRDVEFGFGLVQYTDAPLEETVEPEDPIEPEEPIEEDEVTDIPEDEGEENNEEVTDLEGETPEDNLDEVDKIVEVPNEEETDSGSVTDETTDSETPTEDSAIEEGDTETSLEEEIEDESEDETDELDFTSSSTVWIRPYEASGLGLITTEDIESVADHGVLAISFDSTLNNVQRVSLTKEQVSLLKSKGITLLIARIDLEWVIPSANLVDDSATLIFEPNTTLSEHEASAKSDIIRFSIEQNGQHSQALAEPMAYRFFTNDAEGQGDKLYEWNDDSQEWIIFGETYSNGAVIGSSQSTGTFAVFNPNELEGSFIQANSEGESLEETTSDEEEGANVSDTPDETDAAVAQESDGIDTLNTPLAISGAVVILATVSGGFYFFGGKSKE